MKLENRTILITGASSGLGRAVALSLARKGNRLIVTARRESLLLSLKDEVEALGGRCIPIVADATDAAQSLAVIEAGIAAFGSIDAALLNAGGGTGKRMSTVGPEDVLKEMRMNYDTLVNFLCPLIAHMRETGGVIGYTGSPAGFFGLPKSGPYSASKAAGRILLDTCRIELADTPIKFVALYPGFTYTDGLDPKDVPLKALIIDKERAAKEMVYALERQKSHHIFPKRIKFLILFARLLPESFRRWALVLGRLG